MKITKFRQIILAFPKQFRAGLEAAENVKISGKFKDAVVCGMGGSAWPAELLREWLKIPLPFYVNKNYDLPPQTSKNSLIIISSYSGNTEEPISCYHEAKKRKLKTVCLTTGGRIKELSQKEKTPLALLPNDVPAPRLGCGYTFGALSKILIKTGLISDVSRKILASAERIKPEKSEGTGKKLAELIGSKIPIVYASFSLKSLAYVWKIKFNETAKIPAFCNYFPEVNHNELSAYAKPNDIFSTLILKNEAEDYRIIKRMGLTAKIIKSKKMPVEFVYLTGNNLLEKIMNGLILADWTSYYLAKKSGVDPLSLEMQENFKKQLR